MTLLLRRLARLGFLVVMAGCASAPPETAVRSQPLARMEVVNLTERDWEITLAGADGHIRREHIAPHAKVALEAAAGEGVIEQTLLGPAGEAVAGRKIPFWFESGETYEFPLATLMSAATDERRP